jgi:serine/threonine-protein kinase
VDRPEVARRFIEEAQIGGQLQHPGVVPVYDIGRFGQRPFFTMKLVKGQTLAALLGERADPAADRPRFLGIALQVAQTLAYAHAKGVIHRDLKPANVMVGAFGEVQVMDWGLAKVLAEGGVADEERASRAHQAPPDVTTIRTARSMGSGVGTDTEAGSLLGTPAYMPPEQANGDVVLLDRRVDVFGLGAILCEVLTGKPPYVGRSYEEVRRKACNGDLADALARLGACGADAELIALARSCLAPEASDRPKDAQAVADGLAAYLNGVQERLHQAELAEAEAKAKAVEEAKRRRLTLALAATVLLAVTLGGGGWLYLKSERDARLAQLTRDVNEALNQAASLREKAKAATTGGAALFAQARERAQRAVALVDSGPIDPALKEQVGRLQADLDEDEKDRTLMTALDEARLAQAETLSENRFAWERAVPKFREAFAAYGLPAGAGEPTAAAARIRQRPAAVQEAILAALDEWEHLSGESWLEITEPHGQWLRAVQAAAEPDDAWRRQVRAARAENDPAKRRAVLEQLAASTDVATIPVRWLTRLAASLDPTPRVALLRRAQAHYPADFWTNEDLGLALFEVTPPEYAAAVRFLTAAVALRPSSPGCLINLGQALEHNRQVDEAIACYQKAIALDPKYAAAHYNLSAALHRKGQLDEAIACNQKAIELDPGDSNYRNRLGAFLADKGQVDDAIACYHKAIELDPKNAKAHYNLGHALRGKGQVDAAITEYKRAVELDPKSIAAQNSLGVALGMKGQLDEAMASFRKAIALDPKNAGSHTNLGNALERKGRLDEAMACYRKAIELDPKLATAHNNLGSLLELQGQIDLAIASYRKAIELDPKLATAHAGLGSALAERGQVDEAIASYRKSIELNPKDAMTHYELGNLLGGKDQRDEAIACYKKAIELKPDYAEAHCNMGGVLKNQGRFAESLSAYKRGHELGTKQPGWRYPSAKWVRESEWVAAMEAKLPAFLRGEFQPKDTAERLGLASVCDAKKLKHAAARLYAEAFAADPKLADDPRTVHRYNAGSAAALAALAQGKDASQLDDTQKASLRKQALHWLRADLAACAKLLASNPPAARDYVRERLQLFQQDSDLAGFRNKDALAKLPAEERAAWEKLWADVADLRKKSEAPLQRRSDE